MLQYGKHVFPPLCSVPELLSVPWAQAQVQMQARAQAESTGAAQSRGHLRRHLEGFFLCTCTPPQIAADTSGVGHQQAQAVRERKLLSLTSIRHTP